MKRIDLDLEEIINKNEKIDRKLLQEASELQKELEKLPGHEEKGYSINSPFNSNITLCSN